MARLAESEITAMDDSMLLDRLVEEVKISVTAAAGTHEHIIATINILLLRIQIRRRITDQ